MENEVLDNATQAVEEKATKKPFISETLLEVLIAIFLAVTALATAWATWIGSLHGGNQATNYAKSNNIAADGNSRWNEASQNLMQDMLLWNSIGEEALSVLYYEANPVEIEDASIDYKSMALYELFYLCQENLSTRMAEAIGWDVEGAAEAEANATSIEFTMDWVMNYYSESESPFYNSEYVDGYYDDARALLEESEAVLAEGQNDNKLGDTFNLVTVFYSLVLFLLGICGTLKRIPNRFAIVMVAIVIFLVTTVFMFTIPMPTGFSFASFFTK